MLVLVIDLTATKRSQMSRKVSVCHDIDGGASRVDPTRGRKGTYPRCLMILPSTYPLRGITPFHLPYTLIRTQKTHPDRRVSSLTEHPDRPSPSSISPVLTKAATSDPPSSNPSTHPRSTPAQAGSSRSDRPWVPGGSRTSSDGPSSALPPWPRTS